MAKTYNIREDRKDVWKERLSPEEFARFNEVGFDIDMVVELSRRWDIALQLILDDTIIIREEV